MRTTVTEEQITAHADQVRALVADFRTHSRALVDALRAAGIVAAYEAHEEYDGEVHALGSRWSVYLHDPHAELTSAEGVVVEAHLYRPDALDPGFLLAFARSRGMYDDVVALCPAGFVDMVAVLDTLEPGWQTLD
ncbi:hypothetical protein GXB85_15605 [Cellulomonas sp. APG4]|uniref:hypothetical protein n=1 Tax=Cellulomonas sp. APG4 TaxID=1538656 RepID=UPI00137B406F|nr:hypothetical protein [Cellulomonas sp. APG4]NCT92364.1 hypothetical protein [Cellulomonas sp. APG4]